MRAEVNDILKGYPNMVPKQLFEATTYMFKNMYDEKMSSEVGRRIYNDMFEWTGQFLVSDIMINLMSEIVVLGDIVDASDEAALTILEATAKTVSTTFSTHIMKMLLEKYPQYML